LLAPVGEDSSATWRPTPVPETVPEIVATAQSPTSVDPTWTAVAADAAKTVTLTAGETTSCLPSGTSTRRPVVPVSSQGLSRAVLWLQLICLRIETSFRMTQVHRAGTSRTARSLRCPPDWQTSPISFQLVLLVGLTCTPLPSGSLQASANSWENTDEMFAWLP
jgi:hypothetical protein